MSSASAWLGAVFFACAAATAGGQPVPPSAPAAAPLDWAADDQKRIAELASGERREGTQVVLITPAGALPDAEEVALLERLDRGVAALRDVVGRHAWQVVGDQKITYYISADRFVAHASGRGAVFVPLARVQDGKAPFLHEAGHELLATFRRPITPDPGQRDRVVASRPLWLGEGLADYVAQTAAARASISEGDVFDIGGLAGADAACRERLNGPRGADVLPFIGGLGAPEDLFTTRRQSVAPIFYACGTSFTKHLVDRIGLPETIALMPHIVAGTVLPRIEAVAKVPMDTIRAEWRKAIGVP